MQKNDKGKGELANKKLEELRKKKEELDKEEELKRK